MKRHAPYREVLPEGLHGGDRRPAGTGNMVVEVEWLMCGGPVDGNVFDVFSWRDHVYVWTDDEMIRYEPIHVKHAGMIYLVATPQGVPIEMEEEELYDRIKYMELEPVARLS